ncbi:MAG: hydroxyethylthiazole kinase [Spirochaetaceae bacterium]|jgi:hydroxyethylthiazole kinase|nr:hydroxyethylthiazole kinase [Spirochaetaceae bacterium]
MNEKNDLSARAAALIDAVRQKTPLVHCITNYVTVNDCANIALAFGASPAMIDDYDEAADFAALSSSLYVNIGTLSRYQETGILRAMLAAATVKIPIVFDPVGCGAIPRRIAVLECLHAAAPIAIIKGNMGEIMALAGESANVKGVDSAGDADGIEEAARALAQRHSCVVAATGASDVVSDGSRTVRLHNGTPLLTKITGAGCMAGALCAACAAATGDAFLAAITAVSALSIAGETAARTAALPGSFRVALLDAIAALDGQTLGQKIRIGDARPTR